MIQTFCIVFSQEFTPIVKQFSKKDYNASNQNWAVGQTSDGITCFGNNLGLLCFDGSEWTLNRIPGNKIVRSVYIDKNDRIYIGSFEEFGYFEKDTRGQLIYTSLSARLKSYSMQNDEIWNILNFNGEIFFQSFTSFFTLNKRGEITGYRYPYTFLFFNAFKNKIYSHTNQLGFSYLDRQQQNFKPVGKNPLRDPLIALLRFNDNRAILVTKSAGLFVFDGENIVPMQTNIDDLLKKAEINKALLTPDGQIILGTILNGVIALDEHGNKLWALNTSNVLQNNTVLGMFCDKNNNLWLSLDKGIALVQLNSKLHYISEFSPSIGAIYSINRKQNSLFIGTNQGFYRATCTADLKRITNIQLDTKLKGQVWTVGDFDNQTICGNNEETFEILATDARRISPVKGGICIRKGIINGQEVLVQGTYTELCIYKKQNRKWVFSNTVQGFLNPIRYIEIDYTGTIWASHLHKGLYAIRLAPDLKKIEQMTLYKSLDQKNEYNINVFSINNRVVFTDHTGFYTFDDIRKQIIPYTELNKHLGYFAMAYRVCHFRDNLYWFIRDGEAALAKVSADNVRIMDVVQYSLFLNQTVDDYQNIIPLDDTSCLFTLENGLAIYTLHTSSQKKQNVELKIREVRSFDSESKYPDFLTLSSDTLPEISFNKNNVLFKVYYPRYDNLGGFVYKYKLDGLDKVWSEATYSAQKEYNYLQYGKYTFRVRVETQSGQKLSETSYSFEVLPPFYLSIPAKILYLIIALIILYGIYLYIRHQFSVRKEKIHQEQEEIRRKEIEKREQQIIALEKEKLETELTRKSKEMAESTMTIIRKNEILFKIKEEVVQQKNILGSQYPNKYYDRLIKLLDENLTSEDDWVIFRTNFDRIHENFFRNLHIRYPDLTTNDLRFCAYLRLNLSSKDIAHLMNISLKGVEVGRYRIRKKIGLPSEKSLTEFMIEFK